MLHLSKSETMEKRTYITLTIPYVNAAPHIGHALEAVQGDAFARYRRMLGHDVFFVYGSDENSLKNVRAAEKAGEDTVSFVDRHAAVFRDLKHTLALSNDAFIRTTEDRHFAAAQAFWSACKPEDIYKKKYEGLYCVGCEQFYKESELIDGTCPDHKVAPEIIEEENYFFRLSAYQDEILRLFQDNIIDVFPSHRANEMLRFIEKGLEDFSISRSHERAHGWGVPVPGDEEQIMYVWFDALTNYLSVLDYAGNEEKFQTYWVQENSDREVVHVLGKGVARFHLVYWVGMLLSAGLPLPTKEFVHGYVTVEGEKMSKSLGNVVAPKELVDEFGVDAVRYYLLSEISAYHDGDYADERMRSMYVSELANGVGNLTSRIIAMLEKYCNGVVPAADSNRYDIDGYWKQYHEAMESFAFHDVIQRVSKLVKACDTTISEEKPWERAQHGEDISKLLYRLAEALRHVALSLLPIMPDAAARILKQLSIDVHKLGPLVEEQKWGVLKEGTAVQKNLPLFPRI